MENEERIKSWGTEADDFRVGDRVDAGWGIAGWGIEGTIIDIDEDEIMVRWDGEVEFLLPSSLRLVD